MLFKTSETRLATHEDFEDVYNNNTHLGVIPSVGEKEDLKFYRVPGGWVVHQRTIWSGVAATCCFIPFPEKYLPINKK